MSYCARCERVSIKPGAIKPVRISDSWAVQQVGELACLGHGQSGGLGNWPDPFRRLVNFVNMMKGKGL